MKETWQPWFASPSVTSFGEDENMQQNIGNRIYTPLSIARKKPLPSSASNIQLSYARTTSAQDTTTQRNTVYSEFVSTPLALYLFLSLSYSTRTELRLAHPSGTLRTTPLMRLQPGENAPTSFANMIRVWSRDGKKKSILSWSL